MNPIQNPHLIRALARRDRPHVEAAPILLLIRGLPGAGKSTIARALAASGAFDHCEADQFFTGLDGYRFDRGRLADAHAACQSRANAALRKGRNVVVANTFSRRWEMGEYAEIAKGAGARFVVFTASGDFQSEHAVPEAAIEAMRQRWEPTPSEWSLEDEPEDVQDYVLATTEEVREQAE